MPYPPPGQTITADPFFVAPSGRKTSIAGFVTSSNLTILSLFEVSITGDCFSLSSPGTLPGQRLIISFFCEYDVREHIIKKTAIVFFMWLIVLVYKLL